jgi:transposase
VKAYVKRGKNDAADAAAICEAMSRPNMRFVAVKSEDQQATLMKPSPSRKALTGR